MRLFRVTFTGELGFEVNVPADYGRAVWEAIWAEGRKHDAVAYGTEAMHVLRAEKGYIIVGQDTDGTVTPDDAGLGGMVGKAKPDFVGKRSLVREDLARPGRKQIVGLLTENPATVLEEGAQITARAAAPRPAPTRSATSPRPTGAPCSAARSRWPWSRTGGPGWARRSTSRCRTASIAARIVETRLRRPRRSPPQWLTRPRSHRTGPLALHHAVAVGQVGPRTRFALPRRATRRSPPLGAAFGVTPLTEACRARRRGRPRRALARPRRMAAAGARRRSRGARRRTLEAALAGQPHSLVDISHRNAAFEITGEHGPAVLNVGCPLDFDLAAFPVGMCTRTVLGKAEVVLWRRSPQRFHLEVWRSFAPYVLGFLGQAVENEAG